MSIPLRLSRAAPCACPARRRTLLRRGLWALVMWAAAAPAAAQPADRALALADTAYVDLGDPGDAFDLVPGGERTFALWIRHAEPGYHVKILAKFDTTDAYGFSTYVLQDIGTFSGWVDHDARSEAVDYLAGTQVVADRTWHHVALVQRDTLLLGYVDGRLDWTLGIGHAIGGLANDRGLWLGWNGNEVVRFVGEMDEMSVWHRALSRREIRRLMYDRPDVSDPDLVAYWSFDEDDPRQVRDASGNGHHGRIYGPTQRTPARRPVAPPFTEATWFYALCGALGLALVYGLMRLYALRIERQRRHLERLVAERTAEVERQKAQLERQAGQLQELDRAKSRFFANVSHEFRTPLTLSMGPLEDALAGRSGPLSGALRTSLEGVLLNNHRLLHLVNQLLDLARLEAQALTLHVHRVELGDYLRTLAQAFEPLAERRRIAFTRRFPDGPVVAYVDPESFEQVVGNLLSNAFKFNREGGQVQLTLKGTAGGAEIEVRDDGPGIPAAQLPHVFDRFFRVDEARTTPGTGIGLALARELTEQHGGRIAVESREGEGAVFTVYLPPEPAAFAGRDDVVVHDEAVSAGPLARPLPEEARLPAPASGARDVPEEDRTTVLVVEDNAEIRAYVADHLRAHYRVVTAADGLEALDRVRAAVPDLIVSDVMMPRLDGLGLLRTLHASPETDFIPVVLLTARAGAAARIEGLDRGADDYLEKPFLVEELLARVRNLIASRRRLQERLRQTPGTPVPAPPAPHPTHDGPPVDARFVERLREVTAARLADETFDVEALADAMAMDRSHLYRRLVETVGQAPSAYLKTARLARAAGLLDDHAGTVSEIAYAVGFRSVEHFTRSFRAHYGCSPGTYTARTATPPA